MLRRDAKRTRRIPAAPEKSSSSVRIRTERNRQALLACAKISALNDQITKANAETKARIKERLAELRADRDRRATKLREAGALDHQGSTRRLKHDAEVILFARAAEANFAAPGLSTFELHTDSR
jgi:hypothetical protein